MFRTFLVARECWVCNKPPSIQLYSEDGDCVLVSLCLEHWTHTIKAVDKYTAKYAAGTPAPSPLAEVFREGLGIPDRKRVTPPEPATLFDADELEDAE